LQLCISIIVFLLLLDLSRLTHRKFKSYIYWEYYSNENTLHLICFHTHIYILYTYIIYIYYINTYKSITMHADTRAKVLTARSIDMPPAEEKT